LSPGNSNEEANNQSSLERLDQAVAVLAEQLEQVDDHVTNLRVACFAVAAQTKYLVRALLEAEGMHQPADGQASAVEALRAPGSGDAVTASLGTVLAGTRPEWVLSDHFTEPLRASLAALEGLEQVRLHDEVRPPKVPPPVRSAHGISPPLVTDSIPGVRVLSNQTMRLRVQPTNPGPQPQSPPGVGPAHPHAAQH
jgi:hypothetical protein